MNSNHNLPLEELERYEGLFKALADKKRLQILHILYQKGKMCVCDLCELLELTQSKLSYHLKILLDTNFITKEVSGTWSYYDVNKDAVSKILSEQLCCIFRPEDCC